MDVSVECRRAEAWRVPHFWNRDQTICTMVGLLFPGATHLHVHLEMIRIITGDRNRRLAFFDPLLRRTARALIKRA